MFGQNKHYCLKICNQQYIFSIFYAMAAAPSDVYRCYHCELCYDDVKRLFVHTKRHIMTLEPILVFCVMKVNPQSIELSTSTGQ